jgi:hypothetical protein
MTLPKFPMAQRVLHCPWLTIHRQPRIQKIYP